MKKRTKMKLPYLFRERGVRCKWKSESKRGEKEMNGLGREKARGIERWRERES